MSPSINPNRRGQTSVQVWIETPIYVAAKIRAVAERKSMREVVTDFLAWYGGYFEEAPQAAAEDQTDEDAGPDGV